MQHVAAQQLLSDEEVLRRALKQYLQASLKPRRKFSELYGVWQGAHFSDEEIKASEYRIDGKETKTC